ncbi:unnamed protein product [Cuscuta europaea]|uniref:Uncharacterized protein n=1 Tax=Cuscuta europaea TaxID=41803 RepID=A0A9P1E2Q8_CUSEU|nr:unnamed protein product [Cuscuta europaea]
MMRTRRKTVNTVTLMIAVPELTVPTKTTIPATIKVVEPTKTGFVVPELAVQAKTTFQAPINDFEHTETELEALEPPPVHTPPCEQFVEQSIPTNIVSRDNGLQITNYSEKIRATEIDPPSSDNKQ